MEDTLERIAKCRYKTKMDKRSGFWQVDLSAAAQELLAFITPMGRVFKWKVMPFGVANAPALLQELMNKNLYILRQRPLVQEFICRGAEMEAHIDDVSMGTNTQEDHDLRHRQFYIVFSGDPSPNQTGKMQIHERRDGLFRFFKTSQTLSELLQ